MKTLKEIENQYNLEHPNFYVNCVPVNAKCNCCGEQLKRDKSLVLTSNPVKYKYVCSNCNEVFYSEVYVPEIVTNSGSTIGHAHPLQYTEFPAAKTYEVI